MFPTGFFNSRLPYSSCQPATHLAITMAKKFLLERHTDEMFHHCSPAPSPDMVMIKHVQWFLHSKHYLDAYILRPQEIA